MANGKWNTWGIQIEPATISYYVGRNDWLDYKVSLKGLSVDPLARLLAKIAHGYAIISYGLDGFAPILPDLILGKYPTIPFLVGGELTLSPPQSANYHYINFRIEDTGYIVCTIRLFPHVGTPTYRVVVGKLNQDRKRGGYLHQAVQS